MQRKVFLGITPPEYLLKKKRTLTLQHPFRFSTFCRENLSLAGCSSAEPASVSVQQTKFKSENYIYNLFNFPATFKPYSGFQGRQYSGSLLYFFDFHSQF